MKLIMENWRQYVNESQLITPPPWYIRMFPRGFFDIRHSMTVEFIRNIAPRIAREVAKKNPYILGAWALGKGIEYGLEKAAEFEIDKDKKFNKTRKKVSPADALKRMPIEQLQSSLIVLIKAAKIQAEKNGEQIPQDFPKEEEVPGMEKQDIEYNIARLRGIKDK